jgi:UDP-N-acetylmuramate dehydrogenase
MLQIQKQMPLAELTTYKIGGPARFVLQPTSTEEVRESFRWISDNKVPYFILGGGSNVLCGDGPWEGAVLHTPGLSWISQDDHSITVGGGVKSWDLGSYLLGKGLSGLEFLYGLPGTIGGAVTMNARAYGQEIADTLFEATAVSKRGEIRTFHLSEMDYHYKHSILQGGNWVCTAIRFRLRPGDSREIDTKMMANYEDRLHKHQYSHPSAGCVFKNCYDQGQSIGRIIDEAGLKGERLGGACISEDHANFILNRNGATAKEIRGLIAKVQADVQEKKGFRPECEIIFCGNFDESDKIGQPNI